MPAQNAIIHLNLQTEPSSLHPHTGWDLLCRTLQKAVFENLTRLTPQGSVELAAAKSVEISPSQTVYTFTLREALWSDGSKVTASHFERAWKEAIAPQGTCLRPDLFYCIKNAERARKGEVPLTEVGVAATDPHTLVVTLEHPTPYFLELISNGIFAPLATHCIEPSIFNGPFALLTWKEQKRIVLKRNIHYWDAASVKLEEIHCSMVNDPHTALLMFEQGEIDWAGSPFIRLPQDALESLDKQGKLSSQPISAIFWLCCNTEHFPLNSVKIRKALAYSVERSEMAEHVVYGETVSHSIIPPALSLTDDHMLFADDLSLARRLLDEGLEELHTTKEALPPLILTHSDIPEQKKIAQTLAERWTKTLGIAVTLKGCEWNCFFSNLRSGNYDVGGCIWYSIFNDPIYALDFFKERRNTYNVPRWENVHYKQLLDLANTETDPHIRKEHLRQAELILLNEMPIIPLYAANFRYLVSNRLKGVFLSPLGYVDFKWAYTQ